MSKSNSRIFKIAIVLILLAACVVGAYFLSNWLFTSIRIEGESMLPTIEDNDVAVVFKQGDHERGDVVIFNTHKLDSSGNERYYIKRIIALPGDTVEIKETENPGEYGIYVNGELLNEDYLGLNIPSAREFEAAGAVTIPDGYFYFCGDNRLNSEDSRAGMLGELDSIVGRVIAKYSASEGIGDLTLVKRPG